MTFWFFLSLFPLLLILLIIRLLHNPVHCPCFIQSINSNCLFNDILVDSILAAVPQSELDKLSS